jgi:hypothetical protein
VTSLQAVLTKVAELAEAPDSARLSALDSLNKSDGPIQQCQAELEGLVAKLDPMLGRDRMRQFGLRALKWPFSSKDVDKVITTIERTTIY